VSQADPLPTDPPGWGDADRVDAYLGRVGQLPARLAGEDVLRSVVPAGARSVLDLGCGDGRLSALVLDACPAIEAVVAVDASPPMLEHARLRFADEDRVTLKQWDLTECIDAFGSFDLVVSGFAIHHLADDRKRGLYAEVARRLHPGGLFANLEVVSSATPELHAEFLELIGRPADDPEDVLADVETQLEWMRHAGMTQVDCLWRWRGFALLVGRAVPAHRS
jgi:SAM-dependent methyltransferase